MSKPLSAASEGTSRSERVSSVLRDVIARRAAGEALLDEQVLSDHADLAPELPEQLEALHFVEQAELRARSEPSTRGNVACSAPGGDLGHASGSVGAGAQEPDAAAASRPDPRPAPDAFTGYEIQSEIHRGGQGVVYLAVQEATRRRVAIKVFREQRFTMTDGRARFKREVQVLRRLRHPNLVAILDSGIAGDCCYLVMDYIAGASLDEHLAGGAAPLDRVLELFIKIAWAVHAAHVRGIIHRDLKPGNVRVDEAGEPHVLDFGLAKLAGPFSDEPLSSSTMTVTGQFVGSLPWASPEQAEGNPHRIDSRCDIYALGVMLYRALTGSFPYPVTGTFTDVLRHILQTAPQHPGALRPEVNDELDTIVLKCLAKDLDRRYQSAAELARDLERFVAGEAIEAKRDSTWYLIRKMVHRHRVAATAGLAVFALACVSALWLTVLYRAEARARVEAERSTRRASTVQHFLESMLVQPRPTEGGPGYNAAQQHLVAREALDRASRRVEAELAGEPEVEAAVRTAIGRTYHGIGLFAQAEPHLRRALAIRESLLTPPDPELALSLNSLGELLYDLDDLAGAEACFRQALEQRRLLHPNGHPDLAESIENLGWLLQTRSQHAQAAALYEEAMTMLRGLGCDESIKAARLLSRWGQLGFTRHEFDAARSRFVEARRMLEQLNADETPEAVALLVQMGKLEQAGGRLAEAEAFLREAVELARRVHGDEHPDVSWSLNRLGILLHVRGSYTEAEPVLRDACAMNEKLLAQDSPYLARSHESLGRLLLDRGDLPGAQQAYQAAVEVWSRRYRPDQPYLTWCRGRMGCVLAARGDLAAAKALLEPALQQRDAVIAEETDQVVADLCALAEIEQVHGEFDHAVTRLSEALDLAETRIGRDSLEAVIVKTRMGAAITQTGDLSRAEPFLRDALLLAHQQLGEDHPATALCLHNLAQWLVERTLRARDADAQAALPHSQAAGIPEPAESSVGELELARQYADEALRIRQDTLQSGHTAIADSLRLLDRIAQASGDSSQKPAP
ncbi:MAG: serine/threonine protein kinase [Sedimentisphaerales bacterium]|nr:serine/threonine protein kinase [Sedimentisphaerales bacterium]